jgi:hypothetical protein
MASYIVLKDNTRIEIVVTGPFKQAVAKNAQGEVILTGNKLIGSDDKTLLETLALSLSNNSSLDNIQEEFIEPPPTPTPKPTPQQVNDTREKETVQRNTQQETIDNQKSDSKSIEDNTPQNNKLQGKDKIAILIAQKGQEVKKQLIPVVIGLATAAGIKAIGTALEQLPDFCLPEEEVNKILDTRNQIVDKLNGIVNTIDTFAKTIDTLKDIVNPLDSTLTSLTTARTAASIGVKFIPSPPGAPGIAVSSLNDLQIIQDQISPTITKNNVTIGAISLAVSVVATPLLKIINLLNSIDKYLTKCSSSLSSGTAQLTSLNDSLLALEQTKNQVISNPTESTYNGFILDIVEEQFSPTVKRIKAVARNSQGIILLQTPLSFTTTPQVLISELKLIIDKNNLKAN